MSSKTGEAVGARVRCVPYPASAWPDIAAVWADLAGSAPSSFFLSAPWVESWLRVFGPGLKITILLFEGPVEPVGACLLVSGTCGHALLPLRRISLNTAGEDARETAYVEFNGLLCRAGWEDPVAGTLAEFIRDGPWDELALDGFQEGPGYDAVKHAFAGLDLQEQWRNSYYVDLSGLRRSGASFEASLSGHRRKLLRHSIHSYSQLGLLRLELASDLPSAMAMFDEMASWNRRRRADLGRHSVFCSPRFLAFHHSLINRCFAEGSVQLLRLTAGSLTVGLLYNFVQAGKVYFYQAGFNYDLDRRLSPGMVTLMYGIGHALESGFDDWDFLSGEEDYKRALSTGSRRLVWAVFQRPNLKVLLNDAAHRLGGWRVFEHWREARERTARESEK